LKTLKNEITNVDANWISNNTPEYFIEHILLRYWTTGDDVSTFSFKIVKNIRIMFAFYEYLT